MEVVHQHHCHDCGQFHYHSHGKLKDGYETVRHSTCPLCLVKNNVDPDPSICVFNPQWAG